MTRGGIPGWRKSLGLLFGAILHKHSGADRAIQLLTSLIAQLQPEQIQLGVVLSDCWRILQGRGKTMADESNAKFRRFCQAAIRPETPVAQRMELALALGRLGDPRIAKDLINSGKHPIPPALGVDFESTRRSPRWGSGMWSSPVQGLTPPGY